jgi:hypothetical protein
LSFGLPDSVGGSPAEDGVGEAHDNVEDRCEVIGESVGEVLAAEPGDPLALSE